MIYVDASGRDGDAMTTSLLICEDAKSFPCSY